MGVAALKARHRLSRSASLLPTTVVREVGQQKLLATRICDLNLRPEGILEECVEEVIGELRQKGITFVPALGSKTAKWEACSNVAGSYVVLARAEVGSYVAESLAGVVQIAPSTKTC